jgi:flagellar hook-associated protein 1 FlgK
MSNLLAMYSTASNSLDAFQSALSVVQNNVGNASTPGFAKQSLNLEAQPFDVASGLAGGVAARGLKDSRDVYAEDAVQTQVQSLGYYSAQAQGAGTIQSFFDVTGTSGVPAALNQLFQSFSAWSVSPSDGGARQNVLASASGVAAAVNGLASNLSQASQQIDTQIGSAVDQINGIAAQIQQYNTQKMQQAGSASDPGADAQLYSSLQNLAQLTNFSTVTESDGTVTVMLAGGSPLVVGQNVYNLSSSTSVNTQPPPVNPQSPPTAHILDAQGNDVTSQVTSGELGGLLDTRNRLLPSILGDAQQQGSLNQLAQGLADTVNQMLQSGTVSAAPGAAKGTALFTYSSADATDIAGTLAVNAQITPGQLAPVDAAGNANGNANALAALADPGSSTLQGTSLPQFFAQIAAAAGQESQTATANQQTQQQVAAQAESLRDQVSGVSLDAQAVSILQFQRAYQAAAQVLTVLDSIAQTTLNLIQPA